ncbi:MULTISPECIES: N-acetyltransferase [unclassified Crossiella]|uniref:N-acetyltransferase n=1 Tax=unclassified Crossiella TaxID=2620835 RepID=UPI001FFE4FDB|nr:MULTISPECIES: N-acetyltransferase [unclassified Crossiella]MCK2244194.1 N-acetyltransferase [Crossiella sp. S99.2]MCK2257998.1 N-acetyltransferase [Crossiella sp. S99.1]
MITTLADRPELLEPLHAMDTDWPEFLLHDLVSDALWVQVPELFPEYCVVATDGDRVIAYGLAVPYDGTGEDRVPMPDQGWDRILPWAFEDHRAGRPPTTVSALEITVTADALGQGLSGRMLAALGDAARAQGRAELLVPVRPTWKDRQPEVPMAEYVRQTREDGLPVDPWLRVHVRAGGTVERIAPASMTVSGSLVQWREWTGLPFDRDGGVAVPGALSLVQCDVARDFAVYVEPNVWVRHQLVG